MIIQLPEHLQQFVRDQVRAGRYQSEDEVIRDALEQFRKHQEITADQLAQADEALSHQELQRRLFEAGVLSEIKPPITDLTPYQNRQAVPIQGEPLSETVIRERR